MLAHSPAYAQAYQDARSWGVGGSKSRALTAAETLITGALGGQGDLQLAANTLAPYAAAAIGKRFGHGENKNEAAQAIGHFMLGATLAYANGADPLAGGSAAVAAERAAGYPFQQRRQVVALMGIGGGNVQFLDIAFLIGAGMLFVTESV